MVSIYGKHFSNGSNEDTCRNGMTNKLAGTRPFLKKINLQSCHLLRLLFQTWLFAKKIGALPRRQLRFFVSLEVFSPGLICSFCSFLCSFLLSIVFIFVPSSFCSLFCSLPLCLFTYFLTSLIVFFSDLLSFHFSFPISLCWLILPYILLLLNLFSFYYSSSL